MYVLFQSDVWECKMLQRKIGNVRVGDFMFYGDTVRDVGRVEAVQEASDFHGNFIAIVLQAEGDKLVTRRGHSNTLVHTLRPRKKL